VFRRWLHALATTFHVLLLLVRRRRVLRVRCGWRPSAGHSTIPLLLTPSSRVRRIGQLLLQLLLTTTTTATC
jgi:hypothetical protein